MGMAASMGSVPAGRRRKGQAFRSAQCGDHDPPALRRSAGTGNGYSDRMRSRFCRTKKKLNEILAANTGQSLETIAADTERDNWMTAEEAKAYGLIDELVRSR